MKRFALLLAEAAGQVWMFYLLVGWQVVWMAGATIGLPLLKRDPYPFVFCLFLSNLIQLWYLPLLQIKAVADSKSHDNLHSKVDAIHQHLGIKEVQK